MDHMERNVKGKSKFLTSMIAGACAGALISLLDRDTRRSVAASSREIASGIKGMITRPEEMIGQVRQTAETVRNAVERITDDVAFITEKVEDMKDVPRQIAEVMEETKSAFVQESEDRGTQAAAGLIGEGTPDK